MKQNNQNGSLKNKPAYRRVFIVTENPCALIGVEDLKIVKVLPEQESAFRKAYAGRIIQEGGSIQDVIVKFSQSLNY